MRSALFAAMLMAGCAFPEGSAPSDASASCGERFAGPLGENANLLGALQEDADVVVDRLLAAVGDEATAPPEANETGLSWETRQGRARFVREADDRAHVLWAPREGIPGDREALLALVLDAFLVPPEVVREGAAAWNEFHGARVEGTVAIARQDGVVVGPLYEWSPRAEALDDATLLARARDVATCLGAEGEARKGALQVVDGSLAWTMEVGAGCLVRLDAQTGSFIGGTTCAAPDA